MLVSKVQPEIRTKYVDDVLGNYGYFDADAGYELLPRRNPKKAKISYSIRVGQPSVYMEIRYPQVQEGMARLSTASKAPRCYAWARSTIPIRCRPNEPGLRTCCEIAVIIISDRNTSIIKPIRRNRKIASICG